MSSILERAQKALQLVREGRAALKAIADAVSDGREALSTTDRSRLESILEDEKRQSRDAHDELDRALKRVEGGG